MRRKVSIRFRLGLVVPINDVNRDSRSHSKRLPRNQSQRQTLILKVVRLRFLAVGPQIVQYRMVLWNALRRNALACTVRLNSRYVKIKSWVAVMKIAPVKAKCQHKLFVFDAL